MSGKDKKPPLIGSESRSRVKRIVPLAHDRRSASSGPASRYRRDRRDHDGNAREPVAIEKKKRKKMNPHLPAHTRGSARCVIVPRKIVAISDVVVIRNIIIPAGEMWAHTDSRHESARSLPLINFSLCHTRGCRGRGISIESASRRIRLLRFVSESPRVPLSPPSIASITFEEHR